MENEIPVYQVAGAGASVLNSASGWNGTPVAIVFALLFVGFCIIVLRYLLKSSDRSNEIIAKNSESNFALKAAI